nr:hypothetical protein [Caballeronia calidae]
MTYSTRTGRTTYSVPGTGLRYTTSSNKRTRTAAPAEPEHRSARAVIVLAILTVLVVFPVTVLTTLMKAPRR